MSQLLSYGSLLLFIVCAPRARDSSLAAAHVQYAGDAADAVLHRLQALDIVHLKGQHEAHLVVRQLLAILMMQSLCTWYLL